MAQDVAVSRAKRPHKNSTASIPKQKGAKFPGFVAVRADGDHYARTLDADPSVALMIQQVVAKIQPPSQERHPSKTERELREIARTLYSVMHNDIEAPPFLAMATSTSYNPSKPSKENGARDWPSDVGVYE